MNASTLEATGKAREALNALLEAFELEDMTLDTTILVNAVSLLEFDLMNAERTAKERAEA